MADDIIARLRDMLGRDTVLGPEEADFARHRQDFINKAPEDLALLGAAYPRSTGEVSTILALCNEAGVKVTPQGGMTGLAGGGVPAEPSLILSLERMRAIEELDPAAATITVQAGTVLEAVQEAADRAGFFFPLDLGGRGTAQIGGNVSTNAGGNRVIRYGMMRDLVLGVEAVLADGTIVSSLNKMLKNNAGYDLKQLFIGTEGTLGVVTRAVLRLFPRPRSASTAIVAIADYPALLVLMHEAREAFGSTLASFETMWPEFYRLGTTALGRIPPLPHGYGMYVLIETLGIDPEADAARFEAVLADFAGRGLIQDAAIAQSAGQRRAMWEIRDCPGDFTKAGHWPQLSFDVSLPPDRIGAFVPELKSRLEARWSGIRAVFFGHIADSNLHLSAHIPGLDPQPEHEMDEIVYSAVGAWGGSISAEHGIGTVKRDYLHFSRTPEELALMRRLKAALDPKGILNPGKVL